MVDANEKPHILVADDDRLVLGLLTHGLAQSGYRVTGAANGAQALELAERNHPDLVLLDIRMPAMDGLEVGRQLWQKAGVPFIFLSAYGEKEYVEQAAESGALGFLVKPLDVPQIIPTIEAALARAEEIEGLRRTGAQLQTALDSGRETGMAVGILMERHNLGRKEAFEALRSEARSQRRRLADTATEVVKAVETVNRLTGRGRPPD